MNNPELQSPKTVGYQTQSDEDVQNPGPQEEGGQKLLVYDVISPTKLVCLWTFYGCTAPFIFSEPLVVALYEELRTRVSAETPVVLRCPAQFEAEWCSQNKAFMVPPQGSMLEIHG